MKKLNVRPINKTSRRRTPCSDGACGTEPAFNLARVARKVAPDVTQFEEVALMKRIGMFIAATATAAALAGCMHRGVENVSAGDVAIDSLSATRTAILRVDNASTSTVRLYIVMPGMKPNYVAKALPGQVRSWTLDPNMFPAASVSFETRADKGAPVTIGPYKVNKNETVDVVVPADPVTVHASVHKST